MSIHGVVFYFQIYVYIILHLLPGYSISTIRLLFGLTCISYTI